MFNKRKGFTLIELLVVMFIISVLVFLGVPKFKTYTEDARITRLTVEAKELEKASQQYYIRNNDWPRLNDDAYSSDEVKNFSSKIYASTGKVVTLDVDGNYYDIDYSKLSNYISKPINPENYILQNPVGSVYSLYSLSENGEKRLELPLYHDEIIEGMDCYKIPEGSTVTVSSTHKGEGKDIIDGKLSSYWNAPVTYGWAEITFPTPQFLKGIQIANGSSPATNQRFTVTGLKNGVWVDLAVVTLYSPYSGPHILSPINFVEGKYEAIKINIDMSNSWVTLSEVGLIR